MRSSFPALLRSTTAPFTRRFLALGRTCAVLALLLSSLTGQQTPIEDLTSPRAASRERARRFLLDGAPATIAEALERSTEFPERTLHALLELAARAPRPAYLDTLGDPVLRHPSRRVRLATAELLGHRGVLSGSSARREELLEVLLIDPDGEVRRAALEALVAVDHPATVEALVRTLDARLTARDRLAWSLGLASLDAARPVLLDRLRLARRNGTAEERRVLGAKLGRATLLEEERGRLIELFAEIGALLASPDPATSLAGETALLEAAFDLTRACHLEALERELTTLVARYPMLSIPRYRLAFLRATEGYRAERLEDDLRAWLRQVPDFRRPSGLDAHVQADVLRGVAAILHSTPREAVRPFLRAIDRLERALDRLRPWRDPWDLGHEHDHLLGSSDRLVATLPAEELETSLQWRGETLPDPIRPFDAQRRSLLLYRVRVQFLLGLALAFEGPGGGEGNLLEAIVQDAYETAAFEVYRLSVVQRGASLHDIDRFPDFGESLDLVFEGELGLYDVARRCIRRGLAEATVEAVTRLIARIEAIGPWAAAELGTPGAAAEATRTPRFNELLMRYPSRIRIWLAQLILDELGDPDRAEPYFARAARGMEEQVATWPGAARLAATAHHGRGSCAIQSRDGERAIAILSEGIAELESFQRSTEARLGPGSAGWLDPDLASMYVSIAVAQNVLLGRPDAAHGSMEKALALEPTDFNVVLHACYLARAGRFDEARAAIERVPRAPDLYYNLACTHALLGDREKAFAFLESDLTTNYPTLAGRRQQQEWAWNDPDLESLRDEGRFRELCGDPPE